MINSNACIMSLNKSLSAETMRALNALQSAVSNSFSCTSNAYSSIKQLLSQLGERLKENSLVIIAAEPALFYSAKEVFCQALSLKCENSDDVIASLPTSYFPKNEREYRVVAGFPKHSEILFTPNGLFSGFCVANGTQKIIFVPLEEKITSTLLAGPLGELLARFADENNIVVADITDDSDLETAPAQETEKAQEADADGEPKTINVSQDVPVTPPAPAAPVDAPSAATGTDAQSSQRANRTLLIEKASAMVEALKSTGATLAISQSGSFKPLKSVIDTIAGSTDSIVFDDAVVEKWQGGKFNEYFANLAKNTFERCGTDYAGAVSTLYTDATGRFMFYVVADSRGAKITKVTGNDSNEIITKCVLGFVSALKDKVLANAQEEPAQEEVPSNGVVKSSTPLVISAIVLIIAIIASAAVAFYMKGSGDENTTVPETTSYVEELTEPETTTAEETTAEETTGGEEGEESESDTQAEEASAENAEQ